ncbi:hypothetical protein ASPSYDRAFT_163352 [Aspergillus sydowii CBS 593.65]|uniref:Retrograde transport protein Dsl1 C-terminal domain-containing protein n=1 Tax=Aspergillus sydowii CBS 593.65 TaxID=1036612 RepID=A0A1L9T1N8_9EURO|nr:uncharacterized protein ASPSYDRAFT_163352 [Aspergillus sydowii CBS 593.65]OJJ53213.1 hypothetical protein ASPSYDRAFT_163352 [Aspergillus sydowii CBS 593.65]
MATQPSENEICTALLDFAAEGTYPDSENIVAAKFPSSAISEELELITQARDQVETEISSLSRDNDFAIDDWISQAKQLHADLERSRLTAREIVKQHENTKPLQLKVEDAAAKVDLVEKEIVFNQAVTDTLVEVQNLCQRLGATRVLCQNGQITAAIDNLETIERSINLDSCFKHANVTSLLSETLAEMRREIVDLLYSRWNRLLELDQKQGTLSVSVDTLEETISALARLDELPAASDKFQKNLFLGILDPVLLPNVDNYSHGVRVEESSIAVDPEPSPASVSDVLGYIARIFSFLRRSLPDSILISLSDSFIPAVSSKIISHWLSSAIPTELDGLDEFEATLNHVLQFTKTIESLGWYGQEELVSWANQAPRLWLMRRRVDSLDQVRQVLAASNWDPRQVERIEKRQVSETDEVLLDNSASDDWDASWDDEKEETASNADEDVSAWGLDDDTDDADDTKATKPDVPDADEDEARDAWGHSNTLVSSSGAGLLALPTLILAMFKATAPSFYGIKLNAGQMYLYNDSLYLSDQVRQVADDHQLSRLNGDIDALEKFGKLAYSKEMQTQRTILTDLLDGAQGFSQCSEQPFLGDCENAVSATVDRVRDIYKEWQPILSHSALLQAIGSLVSTVTDKIIIDVEDLGDISESQSQKLVSFCNQLSKLEDLFLPQFSDNAESIPMTAVYLAGRHQISVGGGGVVPRILSRRSC